jgi:hypothetical protein
MWVTLTSPFGRLGRLQIEHKAGQHLITATNVHSFTVDLHRNQIDELFVNGARVFIVREALGKGLLRIEADGPRSWQVCASAV